jgi:hypothetical protein
LRGVGGVFFKTLFFNNSNFKNIKDSNPAFGLDCIEKFTAVILQGKILNPEPSK